MPELLRAHADHRAGKEKNPLPFTVTPAIILIQIGEENDRYNHKIQSYLSATGSRYSDARATVEITIIILF